jgi:hypothetical protein
LFNINITNLMMEGGSKEEIANIPIFRYKAPTMTEEANHSDSDGNSPKITHGDSVVTVPEPVPTTKQKKFKLFSKKPTKSTEQDSQKHYDYITIPKAEDAVCSICLCEYEDNELICKLW